MARSNMVTLHDGREIEIKDPWFITHKMYSDFVTDKLSDEAEAEFIARATGLEIADVEQLPEKDYRKLAVAVVKAVITPDPI